MARSVGHERVVRSPCRSNSASTRPATTRSNVPSRCRRSPCASPTPGLGGSAHGTLGKPATALKGSLRLEPTPLKKLLSAFGVEPPVTRDEDALGPFGFESTLDYGPGGVALENIAGKLGATDFRGFVRRAAGADAFEFGLDLDDVDLDRYLPPKAGNEKPRPTVRLAATAPGLACARADA